MALQVLIAGAGPVGLTMAAELLRCGVAVRLIDKSHARSDNSKALVLWSRTLELLAQSDAAAAFIAAGTKVTAMNFFAAGKRRARLGFSKIGGLYPFALMLSQSETERLLEMLLEDRGGKVERQTELTGFADDGGGVTATLRRADGGTEICRADWLIGCDGAHSVTRHGLDLEFFGNTMQADWFLADLHITGLPTPGTELAMFVHEDGVLAVFPISPGRYRIIADHGASVGDQPPAPTLAQIQALLDRRAMPGMVVADPVWLSGFRINERKVKDYRVGRVFLAGDAAHVHSPAGGQGMNTGMQDAFNLAWKLALVASGACGEALLDSYSAERSLVGAQVLKAAGRMTAAATTSNRLLQTLRNAVVPWLVRLPMVQRRLLASFSELAVQYRASPLSAPPVRGLAGPAPGERVRPLPAGQGQNDGRLLRLHAAPGAAIAALPLAYPDLLAAELRPPLAANGVWLVRPDGYVAAVAKAGDVLKIADYLDAIKAG